MGLRALHAGISVSWQCGAEYDRNHESLIPGRRRDEQRLGGSWHSAMAERRGRNEYFELKRATDRKRSACPSSFVTADPSGAICFNDWAFRGGVETIMSSERQSAFARTVNDRFDFAQRTYCDVQIRLVPRRPDAPLAAEHA